MTLLAVETTTLRWRHLPPLWVLFLVLLPLVAASVFWLYRREGRSVGPRLRGGLTLLRIAAILLVLGAFFGPFAETVEGEYTKRHLILCLDTSRSMSFRDSYAREELRSAVAAAAGLPGGANPSEKSRLELAKGILTHDRALLEELCEKFRLHVFTFGDDLAGLAEARGQEKPKEAAARIAEALERAAAEGATTRIGAAIKDLVAAFASKNEPVAGIVLFSDGRHTGGAPFPIEEARRAAEGTREGIPIYPVAIGDPDAAKNVGVSRVHAPEVVLAGDDVAFGVTIHARGFEGRRGTLEAVLLDAAGEPAENLPIEADPFDLPGPEETREVTFRHKFDEPGTYDLRVGVPPLPGEVVVDDNYQRHVVRVVRLKMRVLLVANRPSYEYRFLSQYLLRCEDTIAANLLLLDAEEEWPQEASPGIEPLRAFPGEFTALAPFDVVILLDADPNQARFRGDLGREKVLENLDRWVLAGGGLVLQPGRDANIPRAYVGTTLPSLLPVVPGDTDRLFALANRDLAGESVPDRRYRLTPAGAAHPMLRILRDAEESRRFWDGDDYATYFHSFVPVERAKSGATVLAVRRAGGANSVEDPIIVLQEYGAGKVLWLGTDELWRMRMFVENLYYGRFWTNVIRHLATYRLLGGNKRIKLFPDRSDGRYVFGDTVVIDGRFLDENFQPVEPKEGDSSTLSRIVKLVPPDGPEQEISLDAVPEDPPRGIYRARLQPKRAGTYRVYAEAGRDEERAECTFVVEETTLETRDPLMDARTLDEIARMSRGRLLGPGEFREAVRDGTIASGGIIRTGERRTRDLWDRSHLLWAFVAILAIEWILRRANLLL